MCRHNCRRTFGEVPVLLFAASFILRTPFASHAAPSPIATYDFDAGSGTTLADRSGNNHSGTLVNGPVWTTGKYNSGLSFDGINDYATFGDLVQLDSLAAITVSTWVKFTYAGGGTHETHFLDKSQCAGWSGGGPWELGASLSAAHKAEFVIYPQGAKPTAYLFSGPSTTSIDDGAWHYVTGRYDGSRLSIWVDGNLENSNAIGALTMLNSGSAVELGGHCNGFSQYPFKGSLDDVRLYARALTPAEILADMSTPVGNGGSTPADTTAPSTPTALTASGVTTSQATLSWQASTDNVGVSGYRVYRNGILAGTTSTTTFTSAGLPTNTSYAFTVAAFDSAGNSSSQSVPRSITTPSGGGADTIAPMKPAGVAASGVTASSVTLSWLASTDNVGVAGYGVFRDGVLTGTSTSTTFTQTGLAANTTYTFIVAAVDAAGNVSPTSTPYSVRTAGALDSSGPSIPTGLSSSGVTTSQVTLSWQSSTDNVGVSGYRVYRNGILAGTTSTTTFTSLGLAANTSYVFTVAAFDSAGNSSPQSPSRSVTTATSSSSGGGGSYTTDFNNNERPISEGGVWHRASNSWTDVQTIGGVAFGTNGVTDSYDDSYALLSGFGPDQTAQAVVYRDSSLSPTTSHEVELLLRASDGASHARGYECLFNYAGGTQIVRWNGDFGSFTALNVLDAQSLGRNLVTGDVIKATIVGSEIRVYINGALMGRAVDNTFSTGQPGVAFFNRPGDSQRLLGLTSYTVTSQ